MQSLGVRIHLGHHFYGAGNLGDDFMLAGFLAVMRKLAPSTTYSASVPFPLPPLRQRFPEIDWVPYDADSRARCIAECDAWLGLGGSPFQSAQSRWFVDHLIADAATCRTYRKRMFFLGVGVQSEAEVRTPEIRELCAQASAIWTRDAESAERLSSLGGNRISAASDLAHLLFQQTPPPDPASNRITAVPNFDYAGWPGREAFLAATGSVGACDYVWLAQESRSLPGAEKALYADLPAPAKARWRLVDPDELARVAHQGVATAKAAAAPLSDALRHWPTGEWLVTSRFHATLAGAWSGSKIVVIVTNEKLRGVAKALRLSTATPHASTSEIECAIRNSTPSERPVGEAEAAHRACSEFVAAIRNGAR